MNWKEINKKYPKVINKLFDCLGIEEWYNEDEQRIITKWEQFQNDYLTCHEGHPWNDVIYMTFLIHKGF